MPTFARIFDTPTGRAALAFPRPRASRFGKNEDVKDSCTVTHTGDNAYGVRCQGKAPDGRSCPDRVAVVVSAVLARQGSAPNILLIHCVK